MKFTIIEITERKIPCGLKRRRTVIMPKEKLKHTVKPEIIEPVTSLSNEGKFIHIVSKLPGIAEEKIKIDIDVEKTTITIVATDSTKMYKKIINLPGDVIFYKKRFSDGELHLTVEKKGS
jgi:HSP20 family molecular chaperone IbpA